MLSRLVSLLVLACTAALWVVPAAAQSSNLDTIEGPGSGERTTLMVTPLRLTDGVSGRALGVRSPSGTRWALTLIGVRRSDSLRLTLGTEALPIKDLQRPGADDVGPTHLYLSQETFLTVAEQSKVRLHIGDRTVALPAELRTQMRQIFADVV
jgi:hypothetical protein